MLLPYLPHSHPIPHPVPIDFYLPNNSDIHSLLSKSMILSLPRVANSSVDLSILALLVTSPHGGHHDLFQAYKVFLGESTWFLPTFSYFSVLIAPGDAYG